MLAEISTNSRRRTLIPTQLVESFVVDAEMVSDLVKDRCANFLFERGFVEPESEVRATEDDYAIGESHRVVDATVVERNAFINPENPLPVGVMLRAGSVLHDDNHVFEGCQHPVGKLVQRAVDQLFEFTPIHPESIRVASWV